MGRPKIWRKVNGSLLRKLVYIRETDRQTPLTGDSRVGQRHQTVSMRRQVKPAVTVRTLTLQYILHMHVRTLTLQYILHMRVIYLYIIYICIFRIFVECFYVRLFLWIFVCPNVSLSDCCFEYSCVRMFLFPAVSLNIRAFEYMSECFSVRLFIWIFMCPHICVRMFHSPVVSSNICVSEYSSVRFFSLNTFVSECLSVRMFVQLLPWIFVCPCVGPKSIGALRSLWLLHASPGLRFSQQFCCLHTRYEGLGSSAGTGGSELRAWRNQTAA